MPEIDWQAVLAMRAARLDLESVPPDEVDLELCAAVDALLLAARLSSRWRLCVSAVWVAYRVGVHVGRRFTDPSRT